MAEELITKEQITSISNLIPSLINKTGDKLIIDYDREADVLYISIEKQQEPDDSVMKDNGVIYRYKQKELIGITILDASTRGK